MTEEGFLKVLVEAEMATWRNENIDEDYVEGLPEPGEDEAFNEGALNVDENVRIPRSLLFADSEKDKA